MTDQSVALRPAFPLSTAVMTGLLPFVVVLTAWALAPALSDIPAYKLPPPGKVWSTFTSMTLDGSLLSEIWHSLRRLATV